MINIVRCAKLDNNNIVIQVMDVAYQDCLDENLKFSKETAVKFCESIDSGRWIIGDFFYSHTQRSPDAGSLYIEDKNIFIAPKPDCRFYFDKIDLLWKLKPEFEIYKD